MIRVKALSIKRDYYDLRLINMNNTCHQICMIYHLKCHIGLEEIERVRERDSYCHRFLCLMVHELRILFIDAQLQKEKKRTDC